jgi:hypothetical protein
MLVKPEARDERKNQKSIYMIKKVQATRGTCREELQGKKIFLMKRSAFVKK